MTYKPALLLLLSTAVALVMLAPVYVAIINSLTPIGEVFSPQLHLFPRELILKNYYDVILKTPFPRWLLNSIIISLSYTLLGIFFCSMAGYAFSRLDFFGRERLFFMMIMAMTIPEFVTVVPNFILLSKLGWINSYLALILPFCAHPFAIFLAKQYMDGVPSDILDAARIDGCGDLYIFLRIMLPIVKPIVAAIGVFLFITSWNAYLYPLVLMQDSNMFTVPLGLAAIGSTQEYPQAMVDFTAVLSGVTISVFPIMIVFAFMQKEFVAGLTGGAVKW